MPSHTILPVLAAFSASITWAIGSSTYSLLARSHPSQAINFSRALLVLPLFLIVSMITSFNESGFFLNSLRSLKNDNVVWLIVSNIASFALGDVFFFISTTMVGVPTALAIASTFPVIATAGAIFFDNQILSFYNGFGLFCVVIGTVIVIKTGKKTLTQSISKEKYKTGIILSAITACFWALNTYASAKGALGISPFDANVIRMVSALILCPSIGFLKDKKWTFLLPPTALKKYWPIFILESFFGSTFYMYGISNTPMALGSTLTSLAPVLTVPVALWMGWEKFSLHKTLGIIMVVGGISLLLY